MSLILVIDDDQAIRKLLKLILEKAGHQVLLASSGEQGIILFEKSDIDLVITDILMPGLDGLGVIRELTTKADSAKILALSGGGMILTAETSLNVAQKMGAVRSLSKPFTRPDLLSIVSEMLNS